MLIFMQMKWFLEYDFSSMISLYENSSFFPLSDYTEAKTECLNIKSNGNDFRNQS